VNGNEITHLMHLATLHELKKKHFVHNYKISEIIPEAEVVLGIRKKKRGSREKIGKFDFLVKKEDGKNIGIEVLTRPSKGKLREKLLYANSVDEFVYVLPHSALHPYRKPVHKYDKKKRPKKLPSEFRSPNLKVWLYDLGQRKFYDMCKFNQLFFVE